MVLIYGTERVTRRRRTKPPTTQYQPALVQRTVRTATSQSTRLTSEERSWKSGTGEHFDSMTPEKCADEYR